MVAGHVENEREVSFTIEDNVLKGNPCPLETSYTNIGALLLDKMRANAHLVGQVDTATDVEDMYSDMADRTIKCALWMKKQGIGRGDVVVVCSHNHLDTFVPCLAAFYLGAIFNPWDCHMNAPYARHFMTLSDPKMIFVNESAAGVVQEAARTMNCDPKIVTFGEHPGTTPYADVLKNHSYSDVANFRPVEIEDLRETGTILHSSGTTGLPKGVQLSYYALLYNLAMRSTFRTADQVPLWFSTLYWISGVLLTLHTILAGTKRILAPDFDEELVCKLIEKYKVTWLFLGTSMANRLCKSGFIQKYDLSSLKVFFTGGASLKREAQDDLRNALPHVSILQGYGMTEVGGVISTQLDSSPSGSCGVIARNVDVKIVDPSTGATLPANKAGELFIKAPASTKGYYKNPEATKDVLDEEGWVHSGDLGYWDEKGELFIVERLKELIKFRGHHVSPSEIENLLVLHPGVIEVAVVGVPHPTDDEHPMAFVIKTPGVKVTEGELNDLVDKNLLDCYKLRGGIQFVETLPHTASGKIARKEVKVMAKAMAI